MLPAPVAGTVLDRVERNNRPALGAREQGRIPGKPAQFPPTVVRADPECAGRVRPLARELVWRDGRDALRDAVQELIASSITEGRN